ncbi:Gat2p [Sugiyamaella lignohabitans]|uniref:Gat2p n=1 Tax=Sugiyamaella lignohabitans TaxID=796027 RepID=A0A167DXA2_9ASCO|nr:Gat2p [Sugiyamaella lignohabitans]ANB13404.1 Gat2p [Sugiyamaella lignohabitans]
MQAVLDSTLLPATFSSHDFAMSSMQSPMASYPDQQHQQQHQQHQHQQHQQQQNHQQQQQPHLQQHGQTQFQHYQQYSSQQHPQHQPQVVNQPISPNSYPEGMVYDKRHGAGAGGQVSVAAAAAAAVAANASPSSTPSTTRMAPPTPERSRNPSRVDIPTLHSPHSGSGSSGNSATGTNSAASAAAQAAAAAAAAAANSSSNSSTSLATAGAGSARLADDNSLVCILSPLGTILYVSPSSTTFLGSYPNDIAGSSIMDYIHPDDLDQFISSMSAIVSNGTSLQMIYRLKFAANQYRVYEGFGRPSNEEVDGYQGMGQGMVLISKPATNNHHNQSNGPPSPTSSSNESIWSRRQASRMQKGLVLNQAPAKLEYNEHQQIRSGPATAATNSTSSSNGMVSMTPLDAASVSLYDQSPLSVATNGYTSTISPYEEDISHSSSSSSLLSGLNPPPSATPSLVSFDDSTNWNIDGPPLSATAATGSGAYPYGYSGMRSYSYFDMGNDSTIMEELKSPRAAPNDYYPVKDDSTLNSMNQSANMENHSYWDNVANSELVSPNFFVPNSGASTGSSSSTPTSASNMHTLPKTTYSPSASYFVDSAAQARAKSYSLPGLFDVNAPVRYQPYHQAGVSSSANAAGGNHSHIDFSGYSMSVKKSPVDGGYLNGQAVRKANVNSLAKTRKLSKPPSMSTLPNMASSNLINKTRRKSKQQNRDDMMLYVCTECGVKESPEWRKGPKGPKTLCNACGLRWAKWTRQKSTSHDDK